MDETIISTRQETGSEDTRFHFSKKAGWILSISIVIICFLIVLPTYIQYYEVSRRHTDVINANVIVNEVCTYANDSSNDFSKIPAGKLYEISTLPDEVLPQKFAVSNPKQKNAVFYYYFDSETKGCEVYIGAKGLTDIDDMASGNLTVNKYQLLYWEGLSKDGKSKLAKI